MANIYATGLSGINAAQYGLTTTGHNISNASTPGFSKQSIVQAPQVANATGSGFLGSGVSVLTVSRQYNKFLANQLFSAQSQSSYLDAYNTQISQINNLLADPLAGLSPVLQEFFGGVQNVANNPSLTSARQSMISFGESLSSRFRALGSQLQEMQQGVNSELQSALTQINSYANQVVDLNRKISLAQGVGQQPPNDLMDQRDSIVRDLNKLIQTTVVQQNDGSYNLFIGVGYSLVTGNQAAQLIAKPSVYDSQQYDIAIRTGSTDTLVASNTLTGGSAGAILAFRDETLSPAMNNLGRVAVALSETFNAQHRLGQDLNGQLGTNFFNTLTPRALSSSLNTGNAHLDATVVNAGALTTSDYQVKYAGGNYSVIRVSDGTSSGPFASLPQTIDGLTFNLASGAPNNGDTFLIQPTRLATQQFGVLLKDPAQLAIATPIRTTMGKGDLLTTTGSAQNKGTGVVQSAITTVASLVNSDYELSYTGANYNIRRLSDNTVTNVAALPASVDGLTFTLGSGTPNAGDVFRVTRANQGNATISAGSVSTVGGAPFAGNIRMTYDSGTNTFNVSGGAAPASFTYVAGQDNVLTLSGYTMHFTVGGIPVNGDSFEITPNHSGVEDSRNGLALAGLQMASTIANGAASYQGAYSQMVTAIGSKAREVQVTAKAQGAMLTSAEGNMQSFSGVNLDEEAANLIRYQQAYQAAGKVIQIATTVFNEILAIGRS